MFLFRKRPPAPARNPEPDTAESSPPGDPLDPEIVRIVSSSGHFDAAWYVHRYPDVADFPGGPIAHFIKHGLEEHRAPSPHVSLSNYVNRSKVAVGSKQPAFLQALARSDVAARDLAWLPDDDPSFEYLLERSGTFDAAWYLARYRDVLLSGMAPIRHFVSAGARELRDPGPGFNSEFYAETYPWFSELSRTPIEHYVRFGHRLGLATAGRSSYERWLEAFDELTADDLARIGSDAGPALGTVAGLHVIDGEAAARCEAILTAWGGQIGVACRLSLVRGADVPEAAWSLCRGLAAAADVSILDASAVADGREAGDMLLLAAGPTLPRPHAAYVLAQTLARFGAEAAYADHDHLDAAGARFRPVFKPAMSPEFMRRLPYAGALVAARIGDEGAADLAAAVAAAAAGDAARAWADYLLARPGTVQQAPFLLFHCPGSAGDDADAPFEPWPNGRRISDEGARVPDADLPRATLIIPTRDRGDLLQGCIDSILAETDYAPSRFDIRVVDNGSREPATLAYLDRLRATANVAVVPCPGPFNFSTVCNEGARGAAGEILVFLNNDTSVLQRDWLRKLAGFARRPDIGVVGAQLIYPDGTVQHGGTILGIQGVGAHRLVGVESDRARALDLTREMVAVTGACLAIRRSLFEQFGGFDPILQVAFNDVKLCASALEAGHRNIYVAEPLLTHHESKSRGLDDSRLKQHRNAREAIYVRGRFGALFRNDPSYSPNLSLQRIGDLARPPRVVRPWRRPGPGRRRALFLSRVQGLGFGVSMVLELQAAFLRDRGWDVVIGGPQREGDVTATEFRRASLWDAGAAAAYAVAEGIDCVIAHTPPFFSTARYLGSRPLLYFFDHGEPPPRLFPDWLRREDVDWEKRFCAPLATRVFAISDAVARHQYRADAIVLRNGNTHLASWSPEWAGRRQGLREKFGFGDAFVVLNVCRFGEGERSYKGISRYGEVASDIPYLHPGLAGRTRFILAGRGDPDDVAAVEAMGITAFANVSDAEMAELYAASDLFVSLSEWEGYNLGVGQALAMGLDVVASNIEAHREFGVETPDSVPDICAAVARHHARRAEAAGARRPVLQSWDASLTRLAEMIEADCDAAAGGPWF